jgi:hypothetical protein
VTCAICGGQHHSENHRDVQRWEAHVRVKAWLVSQPCEVWDETHEAREDTP